MPPAPYGAYAAALAASSIDLSPMLELVRPAAPALAGRHRARKGKGHGFKQHARAQAKINARRRRR